MTIITDERCTGYSAPGHPERPARITGTLAKLRAQTELKLNWAAPLVVADEQILRAHTKDDLKSLSTLFWPHSPPLPAFLFPHLLLQLHIIY